MTEIESSKHNRFKIQVSSFCGWREEEEKIVPTTKVSSRFRFGFFWRRGGEGVRGPCFRISCFKIRVSSFLVRRREGGTWFIHFRQLRKSDCTDCRN